MTRIWALGAAVLLALMIGGTALWTSLGQNAPCGGGAVAGGTAAIGGPFTLVDTQGETVTDAQVIDRPTLVYFGYTYCPDVCPLDVSRNLDVVDRLAAKGINAKPVFITVDPERDTRQVMADYTEAMGANLVALTGSADQIAAAAKAYRVYYAKVPGDDPEYYLMNHSAYTYLMLPGNGLATYFKQDAKAGDMADTAACYIGSS